MTFNNIFEKVHHFLVGYTSTDTSRRFLKNISLIGIGTVLSGVFLFLFNIVSARILGPEEFGRYSLAISISQILMVPMVMGLNFAVIKHVAAWENKRATASTAIYSVFGFSILSTIVFLILSPIFSSLLGIEKVIFFVALGFAFFSSLALILKATCQGMQWYKVLSSIEPLTGAITLFSALLFLHAFGAHFWWPAIAYMISFACMAVIMFIKVKPTIKRVRGDILKDMLPYGIYAVIGSISAFLLIASDKLVIHNVLPARELGLYSAFYVVSNSIIINRFLAIVNTVLFPDLSKEKDKRPALATLRKLEWKILAGVFVFDFIVTSITIPLFGKAYPYDGWLVFLFSVSTAFLFVFQLYGTFLNSYGVKGVKIMTYGTIGFGLANLFLNILLVSKYGIHAAAVILVVINFMFYLFSRYFTRKQAISSPPLEPKI